MGKRKRHRHTSAEEFRGLFRRGKPVRVSGIAEKLGVDRSTVTRRMRKHGTLTSINRNAAFCVLPEMCVFDESGFCRFGEVRFFRDGGQVDAIVRSVAASDRGMSSSEVRAATGAKAAMQLLKLVREGRLRREGRPRAYVYLAADADAAARQLARRRGEGERARTVVELLAEESRGNLQLLVQVLLTCLRHPQFDAKGVALSLVRRGCRTCAEQVRELLDRFGIVKKKGSWR